MATILNKQQSTVGGPYAIYTIDVEVGQRTTDTVTLNFSIKTNLKSSTSYLGVGYKLTGYLFIKGAWLSGEVLKESSANWSGTTIHTKTFSVVISGLNPSDTVLNNIKFKVINTGGNAGTLNETSCSDITIPIGHTLPTVAITKIEEMNSNLTGVSANTFVQNLSQKRFTLSATAYEGATIRNYSIANGNNSISSTSNVLTLDFRNKLLNVDTGLVPIVANVSDSLNTIGSIKQNYSSYILYNKPTIEPTSTVVRRNGQTSGRVKLSTSGTYFVGTIGNKTNAPTVRYKFWEKGKTESQTWYTIPSSSVSLSNGKITVSNYEIGSTTTTATNYFDFRKAYDVKIRIQDTFNNYQETTKSIPVGQAIWTELEKRVDFLDLTIQNNHIIEYGSNNDGFYIKFYNGNMITYQKYTVTSDSSWGTWGNLTASKINGTKNYPQQFLEVPTVNVSLETNSVNAWLATYSEGGAGTNAKPPTYQLVRGTSTSGVREFVLNVIAIGRWK